MSAEKIDFERAKELLDSDKSCLMVDVREEEEYITGHAENALLFPVDDIDESSAAMLLPDKNRPIILYCRSGRRREAACEELS